MEILNTLNRNEYKKLKIRNLKKDKVLFYENEICEYVGIIIEGNIRIVTYLPNGNEVIYNTLGKNDIFGNNLIFSSDPVYKGNIVATTDTEVALIDKHELIHLLKTNNDFMMEYLNIQSNFGKQLNSKIKLLSISDAEERLMYYLHENRNEIVFESITDLAKHLYLQRETVSRLISRLVKSKRIIKENNRIRLL